jgi:hypothetical protein
MSIRLGEEPDEPTQAELDQVAADLAAIDRGEKPSWEVAREEFEAGQEDEEVVGEAVGDGEETSSPQSDSRVYAYIPRTVKPSSWSRKTRWGNGTRLLPQPPETASQHVRMQFTFIFSRLMTEGWNFCRQHEKQDPAWYVDYAKLLAREAVTRHVADCTTGCSEATWRWLLDRTDKTPTLDATPYPTPYVRRDI